MSEPVREGRHRGRRRRNRSRHRNPNANQPQPLAARTAVHFQRGDRQRGKDYLLEGRVNLEVAGTRAHARVAGTERGAYGVGVDWSTVEDRAIHAFCHCQRFAKGNACKHLWATFLALADAGPEAQPSGTGKVELILDPASAWPELEGIAPEEPQRAPRAAVAPDRGRRGRPRPVRGGRAAGEDLPWRSQLTALREEARRIADLRPPAEAPTHTEPERDVALALNAVASQHAGAFVLDVLTRRPSGRLERTGAEPDEIEALLERQLGSQAGPIVVTAMAGEPAHRRGRGRPQPNGKGLQRLRVSAELAHRWFPALAKAGALVRLDGRGGEPRPLSWDEQDPWSLALRLETGPGGLGRLAGCLRREREHVPLTVVDLMIPDRPDGALLVCDDVVTRLQLTSHRDLEWLDVLREAGEIVVPRTDFEEVLTSVLELPGLPAIDSPEELQLTPAHAAPVPRLMLTPDSTVALTEPPLRADLSFGYAGTPIAAGDPRPALVDWERRTFVRRDMDAEHRALVRLLEAGLQPVISNQGHGLELRPRDLPAVVEPLLGDGWEVVVKGTTLRPPRPPSLRLESGLDWFELKGRVDFGASSVTLSAILAAVKRGESFVQLDDGSQGLIPASFAETCDSLSDLAQDSTDGGLRFLPSQALLVDALLSALPPAAADAAFAELREKLRSFDRVKPKKEPRGFGGTLREYQRAGLGWLDFLREFGLGGVLADDMGLGKTVQVLALLKAHRTAAKSTKLPYLVVAPRSLVFNWIDEAARFTPSLKVVEYRGSEREALRPNLGDYDLVVTTYETMRRDIGFLATVELDTVILDEAQAIKNRDSQAAKASRLLNARHRLALTGTPIENHIGELGSLFEFLNPGLLGRMPRLEVLAGGRAPSREELALVAQGLRPFILRRTKSQVLQDLPPKTEQVLACSLTPKQREIYDQLRAGYQATLLDQVEREGVGRSAIQVLEALLRLRQVACHPGMVNPEWDDAGSAKLDALLEHLTEVIDEGHKLLVFSQFTKLLGYVRTELEQRKVPFAYLDGKTRNRADIVERFQTDPDCRVFLVSLKAGGVGLNLTAAGYVFLLDPWWNPAVEAQAIDRAHRIGQTQPVFSYRLIAKDTVEEKILELQRSKKALAEAILDEGGGVGVGDLTADDLRMLLA